MENKGIDKYKVLAVLVRGFFEAFASGIVGSMVGDRDERHNPRTIKRAMLEHYGSISAEFHPLAFTLISSLNHDYDTIMERLSSVHDGELTPELLLSIACADDAMRQAVVAEYKRNFARLLEGRFETMSEHMDNYTRNAGQSDTVGVDIAISTIVKMEARAYARGVFIGGKGHARPDMQTLYALQICTMPLLLSDKPVDIYAEGDTMDNLLLKACGSEKNAQLLVEAMNIAEMELMDENGANAAQ